MITVSLRYGTYRLTAVSVSEGTTVADIKRDFGAALGLPEACEALVNNEPVTDSHVLEDGDNVSFEKQACKKS